MSGDLTGLCLYMSGRVKFVKRNTSHGMALAEEEKIQFYFEASAFLMCTISSSKNIKW